LLVAFAAIYPPSLTPDHPREPVSYALVIAFVGAAYLAAGIRAWHEHPKNIVGPLMLAVGFAWLSYQLAWLPADGALGTLPYAWQFVTDSLEVGFLAWLALVYPIGRFRFRREWIVVAAAWALWAWGHTLNFLTTGPVCRGCHNLLTPIQPLLVLGSASDWLGRVAGVGGLVVTAVVIVLIVLHWRKATSRGRRSILPLVLMSVPVASWVVLSLLLGLGVATVPGWVFPWFNIALVSIPAGYAYTRLRDRWERGRVGDLIIGLGSRGPTNELQLALARTLHDPTLVVGYWLSEEKRFADLDGKEVVLPAVGDRLRTSTLLKRGDEPLAVIVHDIAVGDEPALMSAAAAAVTMAIENERLQSLVRTQLDEVRASRRRIVAAHDEERRRLERDLHDGAQQRLLTLALVLGEAQAKLAKDGDPTIREALDGAATEVGSALAELRELAAGIHPAVLARSGLTAAVRSLAERSPVPVVVEGPDVGRLPEAIEATGYFVVSEALANVLKHGHASSVTVRLLSTPRALRIEVLDDGVGGADVRNGTGLRGMADRVRAVDGTLSVISPPGKGTEIVAELPCASS
jgi:signal transduction histidine kinase